MRKPNILFILMDDLGWTDLTCYGSSFYETPNLDKLASESVRFTNAYAACPVCSPTRASIMSGKYPAHVGVTNFIGGHTQGKLVDVPYLRQLPHSETSLAQALHDGGYATWHVGKWHLGDEPYYPETHGFDVNVAGCHWGMPGFGYFAPWSNPKLGDGVDGEYLTDRLTDEAVALIESNPPDQPFFLNLWYYSVHIPIQAKEDKIRKYEAKAKALGLDKLDPLEIGEPFPCEHKKHLNVVRRRFQSDPAYAAMVESVDENIGRVLKAIEDAGQADNTLVVFTSDNGGLATAEGSPTCNAPLAEGKGWMYEGGTREPLLVKWPGQAASGAICETPVTSPDFYPTLLDVAGLPPRPEQATDGESIVPLLREDGDLEREAVFWHYPHYGNQGGTPGCSVRCGDWKLIEFFEDGHLELYNLRDDPSEETNRAKDEPALVSQLHTQLVAWRESIEAKIPQPNPDYVPWR